MLKIFWPNPESLFLTNPSGDGAGNSAPTRISGQQQYLWRAADQDGDVIDILLQSRRDQLAASGSFADCCAAKARNHSESSPTS
jgi:hypothetical protein